MRHAHCKTWSTLIVAVALLGGTAWAADVPAANATATEHGSDRSADHPAPDKPAAASPAPEHFKSEQQTSEGSVLVAGRRLDYQAVAGTLVVHAKDWDDVPQNADPDDRKSAPEASMFYVAYFAKDRDHAPRPIAFLYNGGPGSATVWLHMGAFGPKRVVTADDTHTAPAPYAIVNNDSSLLDACDLVFIDAPGTGFSRIAGRDMQKAFYGIDADAEAFADFIQQFLSKYGRWNSPKFLIGESYGTTRNSVLINLLQTDKSVDFNGVINISQVQLWEGLPDLGGLNPAVSLPFETALPSYAATAWYHHRLPNAPADLHSLLTEVEHYALNDYALALNAGGALDPARRHEVAQRLHDYTGLPVDYIEKANLRVTAGEFEKQLRADEGLTVGRLDARFSGPTLDPLSKAADYDPQSAAISSAYVSAFNSYVRSDLKFGQDRAYKPEPAEVGRAWNFNRKPVIADFPVTLTPNVLGDLATAMKYNPRLKVMLNAGYYDLATPYYQGVYEFNQLAIPPALRANLETKFYESGHMVYAHEASLKAIHDNIADFIRRASVP